ncbi:MAG: hypothetical protein ABR973_17210 [Candidatus Acidiferrales bacterium]|jgi:hypothetical protein
MSIPDLENFDVVIGVTPPRFANLFASETGRAFLMSNGFAPEKELWRSVEDMPGWQCLAFDKSDTDTALVWGRELARSIAKRCHERGAALRLGFMSGKRTIEAIDS